VDWIHLAQDRYQWRAFVNTVRKRRVHKWRGILKCSKSEEEGSRIFNYDINKSLVPSLFRTFHQVLRLFSIHDTDRNEVIL
jgi:hypothetical protein